MPRVNKVLFSFKPLQIASNPWFEILFPETLRKVRVLLKRRISESDSIAIGPALFLWSPSSEPMSNSTNDWLYLKHSIRAWPPLRPIALFLRLTLTIVVDLVKESAKRQAPSFSSRFLSKFTLEMFSCLFRISQIISEALTPRPRSSSCSFRLKQFFLQ